MPLQKLTFRPGIDRDHTRYSDEGAWWDMDKVRFFSGFPQKIGGWQQLGSFTFQGSCKFLHNWVTLSGENLLAIGTNLKMYIERSESLYDITPIRKTLTATNPFATTIGSTTVQATIVSHGAIQGDFVTFSGSSAVGGVPAGEINIEHQITLVIGNVISFVVTTAATSTVAAGGGTVTAAFQPNTGSAIYSSGGYGSGPYGLGAYGSFVPLRYGQYVGDNFGEDLIFAIRDGGLFYWTGANAPASLATRGVILANMSGAANAPMIVDNLIVTADRHVLAVGVNPISDISVVANPFTTGAVASPVVTVTLTAHGLTTGDYITVEDATGFDGLVTAELNKQHEITYVTADTFTITLTTGCTVGAVVGGGTAVVIYSQDGAEDPMLVRWCTQDNPLVWTPKVTNTAGDYRLTAGSYTYAVKRMRQENLIWTDVALYSVQFVGPPNTFSFITVAEGISIASVTSVAVVDNVAYWMGRDKFYTYGGTVAPLDCTVRRFVFDDINTSQFAQVEAGANLAFNEVTWWYCASGSSTPDRYVTYNYAERVWTMGSMARTSWLDSQLRGKPISTGTDGKVYYHEVGSDDGSTNPPTAITAYIESADIDLGEGDKFMFVQRCIPDVDFSNSAAVVPAAILTLKTRNFPGSNFVQSNARTVSQTAVVPFDQFTEQVWTRLRGRQVVFRIESTSTGVAWRLGVPRLDLRVDGSR